MSKAQAYRTLAPMAAVDPANLQALSVSQLNSLIKEILEPGLAAIRVRGELSNCRPASSGHWYFTLKDNLSIISGVMFRNRAINLGFVPADGMEVEVFGSISVYEKRGSYQVVVEDMDRVGDGSILMVLEDRKRRLAAEGLFDATNKIPLPLFPKKVAVITSPTGAAVRDVINVLGRRAPGIDIIVVPALVQGEGAAEALAAQLRLADQWRLADVIIIGRGGGSLEDLLPFSEEILVRAVATCSTPIISAVGHEIDTALTDYAADVRAPTPSAAAELVAASREELQARVLNAGHSIARGFLQAWQAVQRAIKPFSSELLEQSFRAFQQPWLQRLDDAKEDLINAIDDHRRDLRARFEAVSRELAACSPYDILARGYAIVERVPGRSVVATARELAGGDQVQLRFHDGMRGATIDKEGN